MTSSGQAPAFSPWPGGAALAACIAFMACATWLSWPMPQAAFRSDDSPVSWLSSAQLWALAFVSLQLGSQRLLRPGLAAWLALAMAMMAFDEQFMWHEQWKHGCPLGPGLCAHGWLRELPMLAVALVGVLTAAWLHRALPRAARVWLWAGIATGLAALTVRQLQPELLAAWEEGLEVLAQALFAGALLGLRRP